MRARCCAVPHHALAATHAALRPPACIYVQVAHHFLGGPQALALEEELYARLVHVSAEIHGTVRTHVGRYNLRAGHATPFMATACHYLALLRQIRWAAGRLTGQYCIHLMVAHMDGSREGGRAVCLAAPGWLSSAWRTATSTATLYLKQVERVRMFLRAVATHVAFRHTSRR